MLDIHSEVKFCQKLQSPSNFLSITNGKISFGVTEVQKKKFEHRSNFP